MAQRDDIRLDHYLVDHYGVTRNRAKQLIESGLVEVGGVLAHKPGLEVSEGDRVVLKESPLLHWVSRSAQKLDGFLAEHPEIVVTGTLCLDVGSSTGGFTQVLLERGASHVDAVDVGSAQLHESLRSDPRVTSYEQTDIRDFGGEMYDIIVCDASFISLSLIIDAILSHATPETDIILLYKPQFEVGREHLSKHGVPKGKDIVERAKKEFEKVLAERQVEILAIEKSSLIGEAGNQEWIYYIRIKK